MSTQITKKKMEFDEYIKSYLALCENFEKIAQKEIDSVLNLNIPFLVSMRKAVKMKVIDYVKKTGKITPAKKKEIIKALRTPKDGLLPPFVDVSVFSAVAGEVSSLLSSPLKNKK